LHSQISLKAIAPLRFMSGDEDIRATLYEEFGDALYTDFARVAPALAQRLATWSSDDDNDDDDTPTSKGLPEKTQNDCSTPEAGNVMARGRRGDHRYLTEPWRCRIHGLQRVP
jgi:type I restriction enzyme M protein